MKNQELAEELLDYYRTSTLETLRGDLEAYRAGTVGREPNAKEQGVIATWNLLIERKEQLVAQMRGIAAR